MGTLEKDQKFPSVRVLSVGGEPLLRDDLHYFNRHFPGHCRLSHALGPTECLTVCWALIPHGAQITETKLPIGYPLKDKDVLVLDDNRRELGDGEVGELAVKSRHISLGYWRDPERTRAVFLPDPAGTWRSNLPHRRSWHEKSGRLPGPRWPRGLPGKNPWLSN